MRHEWAEFSEFLERLVLGTKYGQGSERILDILKYLSEDIAEIEVLELQLYHEQVKHAEELAQIRQKSVKSIRGLVKQVEEAE